MVKWRYIPTKMFANNWCWVDLNKNVDYWNMKGMICISKTIYLNSPWKCQTLTTKYVKMKHAIMRYGECTSKIWRDIHVICVTWAGGICLICLHEPEHLRVNMNISGKSWAHIVIALENVKFPCPGNVQYRSEFPVLLQEMYRKFGSILYISCTEKFHFSFSVVLSNTFSALKICWNLPFAMLPLYNDRCCLWFCMVCLCI